VRILVLHLSDLHLAVARHGVEDRARVISNTLREFAPAIQTVVVAVSGDISNNGMETEYAVARRFFDVLITEISAIGGIGSVKAAFVPGNHDCNLSGNRKQRAHLVKAMRGATEFEEPQILTCLAAQAEYQAFQQRYTDMELSPGAMYWRQQFACGDQQIVVHCYNTAWLSDEQERQGEVRYPSRVVPGDTTDSILAISLLHHPLNWLRFQDARALRRILNSRSDVVLTGHEHDPEIQDSPPIPDDQLAHVEGGVLFHSRDEFSTYNLMVVDVERKQWQAKTYTWKKDQGLYVPVREGRWRDFERNSSYVAGSFPLTEEYANRLDDIEVPLNHPRKGTLRLSDIFVYPDFLEMQRAGEEREEYSVTDGERAPEFVLDKRYVIFFGESQTGKTSLLRMLFRDLQQQGLVPVLVEGSRLRSADVDEAKQVVWRAVEEQYGTRLLDQFKQLPPHRSCLLIDDFDEARLPSRYHDRLLGRLALAFGHVVVAADSTLLLEERAQTPDQREDTPFRRCEMQRLGRRSRAEVIEKWVSLGREESAELDELEKEVGGAERVVNEVLGTNLAPAMPIVVLSILKMRESASPFELGPGSISYYYQYLVNDALLLRARKIPVDTQHSFLSELAYDMLSSERGYTTADQMRELHARFQQKYADRTPLGALLDVLSEERVLLQVDDRTSFRYRYLFYYFAASYLSRHIRSRDEGDVVRSMIERLAASLHRQGHANVLLFLVHLCGDPFVLEQILKVASDIMPTEEEARFAEDVEVFGRWMREEPQLTAPTNTPEEARDERRRALDRHDSAPRDEEVLDEESPSENKSVLEHRAAYYSIGILGQMLRHYPGSLTAVDKKALADTAFGLGLRVMHSLFGAVQEWEPPLRNAKVMLLGGGHARMMEPHEFLALLARRLASAVIFRLVDSAGSDKLAETYRQVLEANNTTALRVIDAAMKLEHVEIVQEDELVELYVSSKRNPWVATLIRFLWLRRIYYSPPRRTIVQRVCRKLGIREASAVQIRALGDRSRQDKSDSR